MVALVPGRGCGECNACCGFFEIGELAKPGGTLCPHWKTPGGCGIYGTRPQVCRDFYCYWLQSEALGDAWRPDRSGFMLQETESNIPAHFRIRRGLVFSLVGPDAALEDERFVDLVTAKVRERVPVFLCVLGPGNVGTRSILLNNDLAAAVARQDRARILVQLRAALAVIRAG